MARQSGIYTITGMYGNLCFYQMGDGYYVRMSSSLSGKRVKTDAAFATTMQYARMLATASRIASIFYQKLPKEKKNQGSFRKLTGVVMGMLKDGIAKEEILEYLATNYLQPKKKQAKPVNRIIIDAKLRQDFFLQFVADSIFTERQGEPAHILPASIYYPP